ncbi:dicarboxylate/amino acid:cation symporter [Caulobacter segnis]|uniref:dicarboxylate/amino acid:cation symporter n=1 Tax=Caulobacter segnis TaxID=88688 RepID=UPI00240EB7F7|nr:dicarboxylate/amino acid:cation symporter [Caulobacter segnis]MDG2523421.1 dicarboxylate/amino acid:cation symporter [Caulobacter segnis]
MLKWWFAIPLWKRILGFLVLGVVVGLVFREHAVHVKVLGDIFVRLIRMVVAPLVFTIIAAGVASLADSRKLGSLGIRTLTLFVCTAAVAVAVGMGVGTIFEPGFGANISSASPQLIDPGRTMGEQLLGLIPINPIKALADGDMLAIIVFAIFVGAGILAAGPRAAPLAAMLDAASAVMLHIVKFVMEVAPFGVFGLVATAIGANGPAVFLNIGLLALCVIIASAVQSLIVHGLLLRIVARLPVMPFYLSILDAIVVAFSTASSSATLPVAMQVAERNLKLGKPIISTVLPLGASIGRDGTALYVGLLAMFSAQVLGVQLGPVQYVMILITATLVALGTAPVPSASLFMLAAVLSTLGIPDERTALIVGFILPFDRLLDMIRTIPNATCNLAVATTVARFEKEIDVEAYRKAPHE